MAPARPPNTPGRHPRQACDVSGPIRFLHPTAAYVEHQHQQPPQTAPIPDAKPAADDRGRSATRRDDNDDDEDASPPTATAAAAASAVGSATAVPGSGAGGGVYYHLWRSRDNRKGRHAVVVAGGKQGGGGGGGGGGERAAVVTHPRRTDSLAESLRGVWRMLVLYPVWDVSYDVAVVFTLGGFAVSYRVSSCFILGLAWLSF
jgi:hypothetical protein